MSGFVLADVDAFLAARLKADEGLREILGATAERPRVYNGRAPRDANFPCVIFAYRPDTARTMGGVGGSPILTHASYVVKGVARGSGATDLREIAGRIAELMSPLTAGTEMDTSYGSFVEDGLVHYSETVDGAEYRHMGYVYLVQAHR